MRDRATDLRSAAQRAVQVVATDLLGHGVGDRLPTTVEYQQLSQVGSGTVQRAVRTLEECGAVSLSRHGHRGTQILEIEYGLLWSLAGRQLVRIVVPIPGAIDVFGLCKGMRAEFGRLAVPSDVSYLPGSGARAAYVRDGHADVAVMSSHAVTGVPRTTRSRLDAVELGPETFYGNDSLVVLSGRSSKRRGTAKSPLLVGRISASDDHVRLTEDEFPESSMVEYVDLAYNSVPSAILQGRVDTGVWHRTLLLAPLDSLGLLERPLKTQTARTTMSAAALVIRREDEGMRRLLSRVDMSEVEGIQKELKDLDPTAPETLKHVWTQ